MNFEINSMFSPLFVIIFFLTRTIFCPLVCVRVYIYILVVESRGVKQNDLRNLGFILFYVFFLGYVQCLNLEGIRPFLKRISSGCDHEVY